MNYFIFMATLLSSLSFPVFAGFEVINEDYAPAKAPRQDPGKTAALAKDPVSNAGLKHAGRKPAIIPAAKGFGKDVPLRDAISQIVPDAFRVYNDNGVDLEGMSSWSSSASNGWTGSLDQLFRAAGISGVVDWDARTVSILGMESPKTPAAAIKKTGRRMTGRFDVEPSSSPSEDRAPVLQDLKHKVDPPDVAHPVSKKVILVERNGVPGKEDLWEMTKAVSEGKTIVITGFSESSSERDRIKWSNKRAEALRKKLEDMGFPANSMSVDTRTQYKTTGDSPRVEISISGKGL